MVDRVHPPFFRDVYTVVRTKARHTIGTKDKVILLHIPDNYDKFKSIEK